MTIDKVECPRCRGVGYVMVSVMGARLVSLRKEAGLTQTQLARILGITNAMISYIESGRRIGSADLYLKAAKHFNVSVDWLFGLSEKR